MSVKSTARHRHVFHSAAFRNLFCARFLTVLGNGIAPIALAFAVLDIGGSAADLGMVVAARSIFNVAFLLIGGVLADRYSRSAVLLGSSVTAALSQGLVAWLVLDGSATLLWLALLGTVNGAAAGVALPASSAMVPQTVPTHHLRQANGFIQLGIYAGTVIGASLGGVLTGAVGPGWGLAVDALGFGASAPLYFLIRIDAAQRVTSQTNVLQDLRDGWREFISRVWVWSIVAQFTIVNAAFSGMVMILGPVIADATFGRTHWGMVVAAESIGLIVGSFIALRWRPLRDLFIGVMLVAFCAVPIVMLAVAPSVPLLMAAFLLAGACFGQFGVVWAHSLQTHIPPEKLARVYAYDAMGSFVAIPVGELAAGPLAMQYGTTTVFLAAACAILIATFIVAAIPAIRHFHLTAR
ncbi:MFS transporter [Biostraticola tofi]|uniref:Putative MFS family arabinose efflux permease n=1 Tax=Biostraticola tofi TaxID=466109 RepID=A0A4R3Z4H4_9GAMM|nr:MFS transporter [Biostraticola tofi]TCW00087.1 putative MFS family arabinose efflux permease [Biostraticola tofi]